MQLHRKPDALVKCDLPIEGGNQLYWRVGFRTRFRSLITCSRISVATGQPGDSSEEDTEDFKMHLIGEGLAPTTVHKRLQFARMFFRAAQKRELIGANPFAEVTTKPTTPTDRQHFVTPAETERLLAVCNPTWRVIVALARYGGLRCPSEVLSLRWQDVDWETERIVVPSPKTAHHPGKGNRTIPLFAELNPILSEAFELAPEGAEYVVGGGYRKSANTPSGWRNCNLRTQFERLIKRAGLQPWPRLFHALRASRETELAHDYPLHVVTNWLGNTPRIALRHYLQVTDADFAQAARRGAECGAQVAQNAAQQAHAARRTHSQETTKAPAVTRGLCECGAMTGERTPDRRAERTGFEPADQLPGHGFSKPALSTTQPPLRSLEP